MNNAIQNALTFNWFQSLLNTLNIKIVVMKMKLDKLLIESLINQDSANDAKTFCLSVPHVKMTQMAISSV